MRSQLYPAIQYKEHFNTSRSHINVIRSQLYASIQYKEHLSTGKSHTKAILSQLYAPIQDKEGFCAIRFTLKRSRVSYIHLYNTKDASAQVSLTFGVSYINLYYGFPDISVTITRFYAKIIYTFLSQVKSPTNYLWYKRMHGENKVKTIHF
jgi:hypothetical protein